MFHADNKKDAETSVSASFFACHQTVDRLNHRNGRRVLRIKVN